MSYSMTLILGFVVGALLVYRPVYTIERQCRAGYRQAFIYGCKKGLTKPDSCVILGEKYGSELEPIWR